MKTKLKKGQTVKLIVGADKGKIFSPIPLISMKLLFKQTGTSDPILRAILVKFSFDMFKLKILFSAKKIVAASELPPPKPPPTGICLSIVIFKGGI